MRLGANIEGYRTAEEWALLHVKKGLGAAYWPHAYPVDNRIIEEYMDAAARHGLVIAEVGIWNNLLDRDPFKREQNVERAIERLRTAERVGARCCVNISGSRSAIWDGPHPDNLTRETFDLVVSTTQFIIDAVKPERTCYALEPMPWMYPHDTQSMLKLIRAVNRKAFGVHVDMCNLVNSYEKVFRTGELTREFFMYLRPYIRSVHAKDTVIDSERLTLHIDEAIPGQGVFDYGELLEQCSKLGDIPIMIEHLKTQQEYDQAIEFIKNKAGEMGFSFTVGY